MAVQATPCLEDRAPAARTQRGFAVVVTALVMARLAQERGPNLDHGRIRAAVRVVADPAVLRYRLMGTDVRPALFHVALVTGLDYAAPDHLLGIVAMHVMTVGAAHFAFKYRMSIGLVDLNALLLVAGEADLRLRELVAHFVVRGVHLVT